MSKHLILRQSLFALVLATALPMVACGDDDPPPRADAGPSDAGPSDGGPTDAGPTDAGTDGGSDAGVTAATFEGFWLMQSWTIDEGGMPVTIERDGMPRGLRGDVVLTATGETTGTMDVRQALLMEGVLAMEVAYPAPMVTVEPTKWVIDVGTEVQIFDWALAGDRLTLTHDPSDPRNTGMPPSEIVVVRATPWTSSTVGSWELLSMDIPSAGSITPDTCWEIDPGVFVKLTMSVIIGARHQITRTMELVAYTDDTCTTATGMSQTDVATGMGEEIDNTSLRMWTIDDMGGSSERLDFDMSLMGTDLTLTRTSCLPTPACETSAPTTVVIRKTG